MRLHIPLMVGLVLVIQGCANQDLARYKAQLAQSTCNQWQPVSRALRTPPPPYDPANVPAEVAITFSANSLHIGHAIGVLPLLDQYLQHLRTPVETRSLDQRVALLEMRRAIADRCDLASLEISAVAAELDCEEEKISQLAGHMGGLESKTESRLNVAAITVGALGVVLAGFHVFNEGNGHVDGPGIAFGIAEAGLGIAMLIQGRRTEVRHPRNALRAIAEGRDPDGIFPASIWYCLVNAPPGQPAANNLRQNLLDRWHDAEDGKGRSASANDALFLGDGGTYSTEQLHKRADRFDQLESSIKLVKQDLLQLVQELDAQER